ncbi:MAG: phasin family protein [Desulfobacterales bacterium]|nr:phasin family protein [Desulfobacterales bacterium]
MLETIKKSVLTGVGMALRSKKEIEALAKEFAEQSDMNQKEAQAFLDDCQKRYDEARSELDKQIETTVETILKRINLPTKKDIEELNRRMDKLAEKLSENEKQA